MGSAGTTGQGIERDRGYRWLPVAVAAACLLFSFGRSPALAVFSEFVVVTPDNTREHGFLIESKRVTDETGKTHVRVIGPVNGHRNAWLIVCKRALDAHEQNFRAMIWDNETRPDVLRIARLNRGRITLPTEGGEDYAYVEIVLPDEEMARSYLYIDYPHPVDDGGYYYSVDLAWYLDGPLGKKSDIRWER